VISTAIFDLETTSLEGDRGIILCGSIQSSLHPGKIITIRTDAVLRGGVFRDFVDSVRTGGTPLVTPEIARKSLLVPLAAEKAIAEGRVVHVSEIG